MIFKAYDIRGIYPEELNETLTEKIALAYTNLLSDENPGKKLNIVVGRDMRLSSLSLSKSVIKGIRSAGHNVVNIGLVSTPSFYFAVAYYKYSGGIQVSASHNPKQYNGLKLTRSQAIPVSGNSGIQDIKIRVQQNKLKKAPSIGKLFTRKNVTQDLVKIQSQGIAKEKIKPLKIVVDAGNAMGALDIEAMFKKLPVKLIKLNFKLDGNFPSHPPDPFQEDNLKILQKAVIKHQADLGIAPDGDGDRYFFVDEKGQLLRPEILRGIMAEIALKENPQATVAYDIRPGKITQDMIDKAGGKAVITKVGHSLIKEKMIQVNACFGGESSGHYFYKLPYGTFEAPVILVYKFLLFVSQKNQPLSEIVKPYRKYFHSGEINSKVKDVKNKLAKIAQKFSTAKITRIDGISVEYPDYWFNVRGSNTEPLIRLNLEAVSKQKMQKYRDQVLKIIRS